MAERLKVSTAGSSVQGNLLLETCFQRRSFGVAGRDHDEVGRRLKLSDGFSMYRLLMMGRDGRAAEGARLEIV